MISNHCALLSKHCVLLSHCCGSLESIVFHCQTVVDCCQHIVCCCQTIVNAVNKALCFIISTLLGAFNFIILKQTKFRSIHVRAMRVKVAKTFTSHNSVQAPNGYFGKTTL